jgi:hypothetical protein
MDFHAITGACEDAELLPTPLAAFLPKLQTVFSHRLAAKPPVSLLYSISGFSFLKSNFALQQAGAQNPCWTRVHSSFL